MKKASLIYRLAFSLVLVSAVMALNGCSTTQTSSLRAAPPGDPYQKVSELVDLPEYIPGLGALYVDPSTLPAGPFLGYDRKGRLSHITYMIPVRDMNNHKAFKGLKGFADGMRVMHTDINYNPGHPGIEEPHYHITLWLIDDAEKKKM